MKTKKRKPALPVDIQLPEGVLREDGTLFVTLRTLDELEKFWQEHKDQFEFACEGKGDDRPIFLRECEWVFGNSKSAVVRTVMRWDELGAGCEFYDWAKHEPASHAGWFLDRDAYRASQIEVGLWSDQDELDYLADCISKTPETYRGWWQLKNLPDGCDPSDWFRRSHEELSDPNMSIAEVEKTLQEQMFEESSELGEEIQYCDRASIEETIAYWRGEQAAGQDYYGRENEVATGA